MRRGQSQLSAQGERSKAGGRREAATDLLLEVGELLVLLCAQGVDLLARLAACVLEALVAVCVRERGASGIEVGERVGRRRGREREKGVTHTHGPLRRSGRPPSLRRGGLRCLELLHGVKGARGVSGEAGADDGRDEEGEGGGGEGGDGQFAACGRGQSVLVRDRGAGLCSPWLEVGEREEDEPTTTTTDLAHLPTLTRLDSSTWLSSSAEHELLPAPTRPPRPRTGTLGALALIRPRPRLGSLATFNPAGSQGKRCAPPAHSFMLGVCC